MKQKRSNSNDVLTAGEQAAISAAAGGFAKLPLAGKVLVVVLVLLIALFLFFHGDPDVPTAYTDVTGDYDPTEWDEKASPQYYRIDGAAIVQHDGIESGHHRRW